MPKQCGLPWGSLRISPRLLSRYSLCSHRLHLSCHVPSAVCLLASQPTLFCILLGWWFSLTGHQAPQCKPHNGVRTQSPDEDYWSSDTGFLCPCHMSSFQTLHAKVTATSLFFKGDQGCDTIHCMEGQVSHTTPQELLRKKLWSRRRHSPGHTLS